MSKGQRRIKNSVPLCLCASVPKNKGLTLIEIMVVVAILAIISSTLFSVFQGSLFSQRRGTNKALIYSEARAALDMMSREIEKAMVDERAGGGVGAKCLGNPVTKIKAGSKAGEFFFIVPTDNTGTADLCEVGYWLKGSDDTLMRHYEISIPNFNLRLDGSSDQLIGNVYDLQFEYFGFNTTTYDWEWFPDWHDGSDNPVAILPRAVKITLVMQYEMEKDVERQDTFITIVNIPGSGQ